MGSDEKSLMNCFTLPLTGKSASLWTYLVALGIQNTPVKWGPA